MPTTRLLTALTALLIVFTTSACGGGGGGGGGQVVPPDGKALSLTPKASFSSDDVCHLLMRTHFGITQQEHDGAMAMGLDAYVDQMVDFQLDPVFEAAALDATIPVEDRDDPSREQLERWWIYIMTHTDQPFVEALAMFWHDHFATLTDVLDGDERWWYFNHLNLVRTSGRANFRQFLFDMATDWVMLDFLDGIRSRVNNINENFAREFWELFTLGEGNGYTQEDIEEAARCFTGYDDFTDANDGDREKIRWEADRHDTGDKTIFGQTITGRSGDTAWLEYFDVIDLTLSERPVAEYIVTKLWEYFVYANPPQELVDQFAQVFRDNNWEIAPVLKTMFKSEAFYSSAAKVGIMKSPVDYGVGFIRSTTLNIEESRLEDGLTASGQRPTRPPNVAGWEHGDLWHSAQNAVERANMIQDCITRRSYQASQNIDLANLLPPGVDANTPPTADEVVDYFEFLLHVDLSQSEEIKYVDFLNSFRQSDGTVVVDPFNPEDSRHVDERVRGLLFMFSQHPAYHVR